MTISPQQYLKLGWCCLYRGYLPRLGKGFDLKVREGNSITRNEKSKNTVL
jgi:hypothetical protein